MSDSPGQHSTTLLAAGAGAALGLVVGSFLTRSMPSRLVRVPVRRWRDSARSSAVLEHNGVVYTSGQVGIIETLESCGVKEQTQQTLAKIDALLEEAGTDKSHVLSAQIWLKDIKRDFADMNEVWNAWVPEGLSKGVRACVEAELARPGILVEVKVTAALPLSSSK